VNFNKLDLIYYSPTGTSKKTIESIANGIGTKLVEHIDLTPQDSAQGNHLIPAGELAAFAVPVYGGRVPSIASQRLQTVKGNGTPAVLVVVYGNRAFEDALLELKDITTGQGFKTIAGAAFIGEHSYSSKATPIAPGRPDTHDLVKAKTFGEMVKTKLDDVTKPLEIPVPGNRPYREKRPSTPRSPETTVESCTLCGACANVCPTNSITVSEKVETIKQTCTACSACVKVCPTAARVWTDEGIMKAAVWLATNFSKRREPEFFL
jgi:ferredoxin